MLHNLLSNLTSNEEPTASVISLGQIWVDIMMDVDDMPSSGGFTVARSTHPAIGGSYRVLQAASRMGSPAKHAGIIGNGIWGTAVRNALNEQGIEHIGPDRLDSDTGFRLVLRNENDKSFIATYGAESQGDESSFSQLDPQPGDIVHISGNSLMDHSAAGIDDFLHEAGNDPHQRPYRIVLNPTNSLHMVSDHLLEDTVLVRPIWSCNRQEARTLAERLGVPYDKESGITVGGGFDKAMSQLCESLGSTLRAPLIVRAGSRGVWLREPGGQVSHIEGFPTKPTHTRSAGSCHTGAFCAMLAQGWSMPDAARIANAAASLAIDHNIAGIPNCPSKEEALALLEDADKPAD